MSISAAGAPRFVGPVFLLLWSLSHASGARAAPAVAAAGGVTPEAAAKDAGTPSPAAALPRLSGLRVEYCATGETVDFPTWRKKIRHKVVSRETVDQIAHRYGVAPWELRRWNGLKKETERVKRGTRLRVQATRIPPGRQKLTYVVEDGDTWWTIAAQHGVRSADLRAYNWPYRGKMKPGNELEMWVDPILRDWIQSEDVVFPPEGSLAIRRGAVGVGAPDDGMLLNGVQIPDREDDGYRLRFADSTYGTSYAVEQFLAAARLFAEQSEYAGTLALGSMSSEGGGRLGHHRSHQTGRDLDVRLPRKAGVSRYARLRVRYIDWLATWELIKAFGQTDVVVIFLDYSRQKHLYKAAKAAGATEEELQTLLQYPRGSYAHRGLVRNFPGHDKHMHVRWACGPCEPECVALVKDEPAP